MNSTMLSRFSYPFPVLKNPHADALQSITDHEWIDKAYLRYYEHDPGTREKYKKTRTAHIASQWFPTASLSRLQPVCRLMLWTLYADEVHEECTPEEIRIRHKRSVAILDGSMTAEDAGIPFGELLATLRTELLAFVSADTMQRFIGGLGRYFTGLEQEMHRKRTATFPGVEECLTIREDSLCLYPFLELQDLDTQVDLPSEIHEHPVLKRLKALAVRMMVCFNEVQSVIKDEATGGIYYNVVKAIQHQRQCSLEDACLEDLRIHNEYMKEFMYLQNFLPDFHEWHDAVVNRVHYISMTLPGWKNVSSRLDRYNTLQGFPSAEKLKQTQNMELRT